jgi:hypothetical protein
MSNAALSLTSKQMIDLAILPDNTNVCWDCPNLGDGGLPQPPTSTPTPTGEFRSFWGGLQQSVTFLHCLVVVANRMNSTWGANDMDGSSGAGPVIKQMSRSRDQSVSFFGCWITLFTWLLDDLNRKMSCFDTRNSCYSVHSQCDI